MDDIVKSVTEAEAKAKEITETAENRAAEILAQAEKQATEIEADGALRLKLYRETTIADATQSAQAAYDKLIEEKSDEARRFADEVIEKTQPQVNEIVGRILNGNSRNE